MINGDFLGRTHSLRSKEHAHPLKVARVGLNSGSGKPRLNTNEHHEIRDRSIEVRRRGNGGRIVHGWLAVASAAQELRGAGVFLRD